MDELDPVVKKLLPNYLHNRLREIDELRNHYNHGDLEQIKRIAHKLAGNAGSYGLPQLGHLGDQIEQVIRLDQIPALLEQYSAMVKYLIERLDVK